MKSIEWCLNRSSFLGRKRWNDFRKLEYELSAKELHIEYLPSLSRLGGDMFGNMFGLTNGSEDFIRTRVEQLNDFLIDLTGGSQNKDKLLVETRLQSSSMDSIGSNEETEGDFFQERHSPDINANYFERSEMKNIHVKKPRPNRKCNLIRVNSILQTRPFRLFLTSDVVDVVEIFNSTNGSRQFHVYKAKH